ncbi:MAG: hypothetical protein DRP00_00295 [Candidatus Aenigmatarchaeota archaeon]|nr:MAG: hypothetical protein DRP00_00295 [Candidatus Aenigmarchaeota archaeon]
MNKFIERVEGYKSILEKAIRDERGEKSIINLGDSLYCIFLSLRSLEDGGEKEIPVGVEEIVREIESEYERKDMVIREIFEEKRKEIKKKSLLFPLAFSAGGGIGALACYELALNLGISPQTSSLIGLGNWISYLALGALGGYAYYKNEMKRFRRKLVDWGERMLKYVNEVLRKF